MPLPPALLAALPPPAHDERPWHTLFSDHAPQEIFDGWRRGFGPGHPEPPAAELLATYLARHVRYSAPRLATYPRPHTSPWPASPEGPWPALEKSGNVAASPWVEEDSPIGVLIALGADPTTTSRGHDALDLALERRWPSVVRQILAHPKCPDAEDLAARRAPAIAEYGLPSLPWSHVLALVGRDVELAEWLARPGMNANQRDTEGRTPLFYALKPEVIDLLMAAGADPHAVAKDERGVLQTWLRPTKAMEAVAKIIGAAPLADREARLGPRLPQGVLSVAVLFDKLRKADAPALALAGSLTDEEAAWRLDRPVPGVAEPGHSQWGPVGYTVVATLNERSNESTGTASRHAYEESRVLDWALALSQADTPGSVRAWLDHETCPGVPDRVLVSMLARTLKPYQFKWQPSWEATLPTDVEWKALAFLALATRDAGRRAVLEQAATTVLGPAWGPTYPEGERLVALERLVSLWSVQTGRGFFGAYLKNRLGPPNGLGAPVTLELLGRHPALASSLLLCIAGMPEGAGEAEAMRWLEKGLRPLPGKHTERLRSFWKKNPRALAKGDALLMDAALPEASAESGGRRMRM